MHCLQGTPLCESVGILNLPGRESLIGLHWATHSPTGQRVQVMWMNGLIKPVCCGGEMTQREIEVLVLAEGVKDAGYYTPRFVRHHILHSHPFLPFTSLCPSYMSHLNLQFYTNKIHNTPSLFCVHVVLLILNIRNR